MTFSESGIKTQSGWQENNHSSHQNSLTNARMLFVYFSSAFPSKTGHCIEQPGLRLDTACMALELSENQTPACHSPGFWLTSVSAPWQIMQLTMHLLALSSRNNLKSGHNESVETFILSHTTMSRLKFCVISYHQVREIAVHTRQTVRCEARPGGVKSLPEMTCCISGPFVPLSQLWTMELAILVRWPI